MPKKSPDDLARENLRRIVKAVGGEFLPPYQNIIRFSKGSYRFTVWMDYVQASRHGRYLGKTCYTISTGREFQYVPPPERQASAVLALNNNPRLFKFWMKHAGKYRI